METIKIGVAGLGFIGPAHIEAIRRIPGLEVVAVYHNGEDVEQKAKALGIPGYYQDFDAFVNHQGLDCVHICTPNFLHYEMSKRALERGLHVVCEKPLATKIEEAEDLIRLATEKGLVHAVHFNIRYYPMIRQMRMMREKGELGEVYSILGSYLQDWLFHNTDYNWRLEPDQSGESRAIADIGSHLMDSLEYITGLRIEEVMADFNTIHKKRMKPKKAVETYSGKLLKAADYEEVPINTEDHATVMVRLSNGNKGSITVSQVAAGRKNRLTMEIAGAKQNICWNSENPNELWQGKRDEANNLLLRDPALFHPEAGKLISFPGGHNEGFPDTSKQMFREVYEAVSKKKQPDNAPYPTFDDGLRELILCEKIIESNKKQAWVKV